MKIDGGGEGCIGTVHNVDVVKLVEGEKSNDKYFLASFWSFLLSASEDGEVRKPTKNQKCDDFFLRA